MDKFYTGVGSRSTPTEVLQLMTYTAKILDKLDYTLRSGGASGADCAFERGSNKHAIYSISRNHTPVSGKASIIPDLEPYRQLVLECCLHYKNIRNQNIKDLHTRNICQVIGHIPSEIIKSDFLLCYTYSGECIGGTATAIRCAERFDIPVFNFGKYATIEEIKVPLKEFLKLHIRK
jgi:hypothetical protein